MKMILAVIQDRDAGPTLDALRERKFGVTQIASTGSFWRQGSVTLLIGVSEQRVGEAIALLREQCHRRQEPQVVPTSAGGRFATPSNYIEAEVGRAVVFLQRRTFCTSVGRAEVHTTVVGAMRKRAKDD